jgi:hypothetical protein
MLSILFYYSYNIKYNSTRECGYWARFADAGTDADKDLADVERIPLCSSAQGSSYGYLRYLGKSKPPEQL